MPFTVEDTRLYDVGKRYHDNIVTFNGNKSMWRGGVRYEDATVIDNPPFSLSAEIELTGMIYENSKSGIEFNGGFAMHIY